MSNVRPGAFGLPALARRAWSYRRVAAVAGAKGSSSAGNVLFQFFLITTLPLAAVGEVNYVIALAMGIGVFVRGGMDIALTRDTSYYWRTGSRPYIASALLWSFRSALIRAIAILVLLGLVALLMGEHLEVWDVVFATSLAFLFTGLLLSSSVLKSIEEIVLGSWVEPGQPFLLAGAAGLFGYWILGTSPSPYALIISSAFVVVLMSAFLLALHLRKYPLEAAPSLGAERRLFLISFLAYMAQWGVIVLLEHFYDPDSLGLFSSALRFGMALNFLLMVSNQFVMPKISTYYRSGDIASLEKLVRRAAGYLFWVGTAIVIIVALVVMLLGAGVVKSLGALVLVVMLGQLVNISTGATGYVLSLTGKESLFLRANIIGVTLGLSLMCLAGIAQLNVLYATIAYSLIPISVTVLSVIYIRRVFGFYCIPDFTLGRSRRA